MFDLRKVFGSQTRKRIMNMLSFLPSSMYLRLFYFSTTGRLLHLRNPNLYTEKLQWLKLNDKHPEYCKLADKLEVREHISSCLGEEYLFPLLGRWRTFDQIDFSLLPNQFVLKCNHDSGSTKVILDKSSLTPKDVKQLRFHFNSRMRHDYYYAGREYQYRGISRFIMAEKLMYDENDPSKGLEDYKFLCFDGEPKLMFVATDRSTDCRFDFFDMDFNHLDIQNIHPNADKPIQKPEKFEEMKQIAAELSKGMRQVRIDLYELNGRIYFGEYTFFHGGGFRLFEPEEWERRLGDWIEI